MADVAAGTAATPAAATGSCQAAVCDGLGAVITVVDDTNLPVDGDPCTADLCEDGNPSHVAVEERSACALAEGVPGYCTAESECVECLTPHDCPGDDATCYWRTCEGGACGLALAPAGTPTTPAAEVGSCQVAVCNGFGGRGLAPDDANLPVDGDPCTADVCDGGVAVNLPFESGTACTSSLGEAGRCSEVVGCVPCPGPSGCAITVSGQVRDSSGDPAPGVWVSIGGRAAIQADAGGRFVVSDVVPPYVALVGDAEDGRGAAWIGLTRPDPTIVIDTPVGDGLPHATVCGVAVGPDPAPLSWRTAYLEVPGGYPDPTGMGWAGDFCTTATWLDAPEAVGTIHAMESVYAVHNERDPYATSQRGYGSVSGVAVVDGGMVSGVEFPLAPVESSLLSVAVSLPSGYEARLWAGAFFGGAYGGAGMGLADFWTAQPWPAFAAPRVAGARVRVFAQVWKYGSVQASSRAVTLSGLEGSVQLELAPPPALLAPESGAVNLGAGTRFALTAHPGADVFSLHLLGGDQATGRFDVTVWAEGQETRLPDFALVGLPFPRQAPITWGARAMGPAGGIDGLASLEHLWLAFGSDAGEEDVVIAGAGGGHGTCR